MNSKLRKIIYHISHHPLDDEDHEFDEDFEAAEKAIRQAVGEEMLELIEANTDHDGSARSISVAKLRQKIKQWQEGEDA